MHQAKGAQRGAHSLPRAPFTISPGPQLGWLVLVVSLTLQKSAFGCRKPRMCPKKIRCGDSAWASERSWGGGGAQSLGGALAPGAPPPPPATSLIHGDAFVLLPGASCPTAWGDLPGVGVGRPTCNNLGKHSPQAHEVENKELAPVLSCKIV